MRRVIVASSARACEVCGYGREKDGADPALGQGLFFGVGRTFILGVGLEE